MGPRPWSRLLVSHQRILLVPERFGDPVVIEFMDKVTTG
jgi:hypothetical protein